MMKEDAKKVNYRLNQMKIAEEKDVFESLNPPLIIIVIQTLCGL